MFVFFVCLNSYFRIFLIFINLTNTWHWRLTLQGFLHDVVAAGVFYLIFSGLWIFIKSVRIRQILFLLFTITWIFVNQVSYEYAYTFNRMAPIRFFLEFRNLDAVGDLTALFWDYVHWKNVLHFIVPLLVSLLLIFKYPTRFLKVKKARHLIYITIFSIGCQSATLTPAIQPVFDSVIHGHLLKFWYYDHDRNATSQNKKKSLPRFSAELRSVVLGKESSPARHLPTITHSKPNVVYIILESFRAHEIGAYGSRLGMTPNFDRYAKQGVLFTNLYSTGHLTKDGQWALLCGNHKHPSSSVFTGFKDHASTCISDLLSDHSYDNWWFHNQSATYDFQGYFMQKHKIKHVKDRLTFPLNSEVLGWGLSDLALMKHTLNSLKEASEPFYWNLLTITNHSPYVAPATFTRDRGQVEILNKFYDTFEYTDFVLGYFLDHFLATPKGKNSLIIITADHGVSKPLPADGLQDRYAVLQKYWIPLLILYPENEKLPPQQIDTLGGQADVMPTIMDILDVAVDVPMFGRSLIRSYENRFAKIMVEEKLIINETHVYKSSPSKEILTLAGEKVSKPVSGIDWFALDSEIDEIQSWMIHQTDPAVLKSTLKKNGWQKY